MTTKRRIIILDDEQMMLNSLARRFASEAREYDVNCYTSVKEALAALDEGECHAFITDVKMPLLTGDQVVNYINQKYPQQRCIVITGQADKQQLKNIQQTGNVEEVLNKPLEFDRLLAALERIADQAEGDSE